MAKRHASRKSKKSMRRSRKAARRSRRRQQRKRGGMAPTNYSLAGSWPSRMSLGQGGDYAQYHAAQHGGSAPLSSIGTPLISQDMEGAAMMTGINKALADVAGLKDQGPSGMAAEVRHVGAGRRRRSQKKGRKGRKGSKKSMRRKSHSRRRRGGGMPALGFDSVSAPGMLLGSKAQYDAAGLNPDYRGAAVEYKMAEIRDRA